MKKICVYGAASESIDRCYFDAAEEIGRLIAENGFGMVYGGGAFGLMGAAARGAKSAGGHVTGVAPEFFRPDGVLFTECDEFIFTDDMRQRKKIMEDCSDGFIVLPGGIGTFDEFFEIYTLRSLGRHSKPIVLLSTDGYYDAMAVLLKNAADRGFMRRSAFGSVPVVFTPQEAVKFICDSI